MMDESSEVLWPALLFTLLAVVVAGVVVLGRNQTHASSNQTRAAATRGRVQNSDEEDEQHSERNKQTQTRGKHQSRDAKDSKKYEGEVIYKSDSPDDPSTAWKEEESGMRNAHRDFALSLDAEGKPLKYMPGMLRTSQMEKMMSKEELEEEQRVQREQLAAIFQLLKDKEDTFGEVTESDLQEQMKLYSI